VRLIGYGIALALVVLALMNYSNNKEDPQGVLPQSYEQSLEKAKGVEQTLQDSAQERLRKMESDPQ
jgi:hypothetical protein